ncbi:MAG: hypothetical protein QOF86_4236, partial [Baekduia sp.]|nr:hypothetical protein [Baekduia sp.]
MRGAALRRANRDRARVPAAHRPGTALMRR